MASRKHEATPVLLKVPVSFWAMWADFPTPLKMSFRPAATVASTARAVATKSAPRDLAVAANAADSSLMHARARVRAVFEERAI